MSAFEVTGPDGRKYRVDAPEGASQQDAIEYIAHQHYGISRAESKPDVDPIKGRMGSIGSGGPGGQHYMDTSSPLLRTVAGIGSGTQEFGRGLGNLVGLGHVFPSVFGEEHIKKEAELDRPISDTTEGSLGQLGGQTIASLPLSMGVGALSNAGRAVPWAGKVLGNAFTRAGVEGAVNASALADVDKQGEAAGAGAATGMALTGALGTVGRVAKGLIQKSGAAQDLQDLVARQGKKLFIPVTQAGDEEGDLVSRGLQSLYTHGLPIVPGVTGQLKRQARIATGTLKQAFEDEYRQTVGSYKFYVPEDFKEQVVAKIKSEMPQVDKTTLDKVSDLIDDHMSRFASGKAEIDGGNLLNAKNASLASRLSPVEKEAAQHGSEAFDDIIEEQLSNHGDVPQNKADLQRYQHLTVKDPETGLALPESAKAMMSQPVARPNTEGRLGLYGAGLYGIAHGFGLPFARTVIGANALATKTAQKFMMGDWAAQEAIAKMVAKHPEMTRGVAMILRGAGETQTGDQYNAP